VEALRANKALSDSGSKVAAFSIRGCMRHLLSFQFGIKSPDIGHIGPVPFVIAMTDRDRGM
jgi:hypothetical protein